MDSLAPEHVLPLLRGRLGRPYRYEPQCESTQRLFEDDAPEGAVAATDHQTAGRGRLGRSWHAPPAAGLLFSVVLRPPVATERLPELSPLAGGAVAAAIGLDATVKFPNDVLIGGKKVCGVLAEARDGRVVLGIGVNVHQRREQLPRADATSLALEGQRVGRAQLLAAILEQLEREYDAWLRRA